MPGSSRSKEVERLELQGPGRLRQEEQEAAAKSEPCDPQTMMAFVLDTRRPYEEPCVNAKSEMSKVVIHNKSGNVSCQAHLLSVEVEVRDLIIKHYPATSARL